MVRAGALTAAQGQQLLAELGAPPEPSLDIPALGGPEAAAEAQQDFAIRHRRGDPLINSSGSEPSVDPLSRLRPEDRGMASQQGLELPDTPPVQPQQRVPTAQERSNAARLQAPVNSTVDIVRGLQEIPASQEISGQQGPAEETRTGTGRPSDAAINANVTVRPGPTELERRAGLFVEKERARRALEEGDALLLAEDMGNDVREEYARLVSEDVDGAQVALETALRERDQYAAQTQELIRGVASRRVDPTQFFSSRGAAGGFAAALNVAAGSLASSLTGNPNTALEILNAAIERDIQAQEFDTNNAARAANLSMGMLDRLRIMARDDLAAVETLRALRWEEAAARIGALQARAASDIHRSRLEELRITAHDRSIVSQGEARRNSLAMNLTATIRNAQDAAAFAGLVGMAQQTGEDATLAAGISQGLLSTAQEERLENARIAREEAQQRAAARRRRSRLTRASVQNPPPAPSPGGIQAPPTAPTSASDVARFQRELETQIVQTVVVNAARAGGQIDDPNAPMFHPTATTRDGERELLWSGNSIQWNISNVGPNGESARAHAVLHPDSQFYIPRPESGGPAAGEEQRAARARRNEGRGDSESYSQLQANLSNVALNAQSLLAIAEQFASGEIRLGVASIRALSTMGEAAAHGRRNAVRANGQIFLADFMGQGVLGDGDRDFNDEIMNMDSFVENTIAAVRGGMSVQQAVGVGLAAAALENEHLQSLNILNRAQAEIPPSGNQRFRQERAARARQRVLEAGRDSTPITEENNLVGGVSGGEAGIGTGTAGVGIEEAPGGAGPAQRELN